MRAALREELLLRLHATVNPPEQTTRGELGERHTFLTGADRSVGVPEERRWDEDYRAGRKLNDELQIPQHDVPPLLVVVVSESHDGAPPCREVLVVDVNPGYCLWSEVERSRREHVLLEVEPKMRAGAADDSHVRLVEVVHVGLEELETC